MNIEGFEKEKMELFTLFSIGQDPKSVADKASFSQAEGIRKQYQAVRNRLTSIDPDVCLAQMVASAFRLSVLHVLRFKLKVRN